MTWNNQEASYYEESTQTLYVCMDCILQEQANKIADPTLKVKKIVFGTQRDTDFHITQEEVNKAKVPTIDEFNIYNPPGTPRIYRMTEASFRVTLTPDNQISYIHPTNHSHELLFRRLKST